MWRKYNKSKMKTDNYYRQQNNLVQLCNYNRQY